MLRARLGVAVLQDDDDDHGGGGGGGGSGVGGGGGDDDDDAYADGHGCSVDDSRRNLKHGSGHDVDVTATDAATILLLFASNMEFPQTSLTCPAIMLRVDMTVMLRRTITTHLARAQALSGALMAGSAERSPGRLYVCGEASAVCLSLLGVRLALRRRNPPARLPRYLRRRPCLCPRLRPCSLRADRGGLLDEQRLRSGWWGSAGPAKTMVTMLVLEMVEAAEVVVMMARHDEGARSGLPTLRVDFASPPLPAVDRNYADASPPRASRSRSLSSRTRPSRLKSDMISAVLLLSHNLPTGVKAAFVQRSM
eukprot:2475221-Rhodomonas_salina.1